MYNPAQIEKKWQKKWFDENIYFTPNPGDNGFDSKKEPFYILDMFPYPSGSGLHVGHASGYIGTDIVARKARLEGKNVLHPMGWDSFGLPAEQYAITTGQHPLKTTAVNTARFKNQLKKLGLSYDWEREINTSDPEYFKWTQWLFLKLIEKDLVYQKTVSVWWCESLKTVLANEEVINGRSERGNHLCIRKPLKQWVLRITAYADRLLEDLKDLDWPDHVKKMQEEWIGKSTGCQIDYQLENSDKIIRVYSTRPDTLFGVNALCLAPEHEWAKELLSKECSASGLEYIKNSMSKSERDRSSQADSITGCFTGSYAVHPMSGDKVPIYIADYVLVDYGTGAVMSVPAHDDRDFKFSKFCNLKITQVIKAPKDFKGDCYCGKGELINSNEFSGTQSDQAIENICNKLEDEGRGERKTNFKIRDWVFSRQRYWGEPFPIYEKENGEWISAKEEDLPITLPEMDDFKPNEDGSSPLGRVPDWVNFKDMPQYAELGLKRVTDTMPGWAGSCWYYLRFMSPKDDKFAVNPDAVNYWKQVDLYVGGVSHAVMHLLYARFWHKVFFDFKIVSEKEPFKKLFNQGLVTAFAYKDKESRLVSVDKVKAAGKKYIHIETGEEVEEFNTKMAKSLNNVVNPDDVIDKYGCDTLRLYEMFMGPLEDEKPWATNGITGCEKFIKRLWNFLVTEDNKIKPEFFTNDIDKSESDKFERAFNACLKRVEDSFKQFNFNTSVAGFMELLNQINTLQAKNLSKNQIEKFMIMISPFCPHIAAEIWHLLGNTDLIDFKEWPKLNKEFLISNEFQLVVSVNGKPRAKKVVASSLGKEQLEEIAKELVLDRIVGKQIIKTIVVPGKLVNIVVK